MGMTIDNHIEVLKSYHHGFTGCAGNLQDSIDVAVDTMRKYQMMEADYNARLKADMVAMLEEIDLQFDEICFYKNMGEWKTVPEIKAEYKAVIRDKINALKADRSEEE